jgi:hypothetical protein
MSQLENMERETAHKALQERFRKELAELTPEIVETFRKLSHIIYLWQIQKL